MKAPATRERGILFSGPMVRAILAGKKTQTRRAVKPTVKGCTVGAYTVGDVVEPVNVEEDGDPWTPIPCRYGAPGDRLWVRETHAAIEGENRPDGTKNVVYRAFDQSRIVSSADNVGEDRNGSTRSVSWWTPSLLMPRWASRITLEVTGVRIERAQAISDADVEAEGVDAAAVEALHRGATPKQRWQAFGDEHTVKALTPFGRWRSAWCLINGRESWESNPWVWVIDFKRTPDIAARLETP